MKHILLILSLISLILSGCVKKHPDRAEQGFQASIKAGRAISLKSMQGFYVVNTNTAGQVSATSIERPVLENFYDYGGNFEAQTFGVPQPTGMSLASDVVIYDDVTDIRYLNKVQFTTDAPLLKEHTDVTDFLGEPNTTYRIKYKLTPNRLIVMKLVDKKELSHYELPYSDYLGNDLYAVPLGGYAINPQRRTKIVNNDNEATNQFRLVDADLQFNEDGSLKYGCKTCADYIQINPDSYTKFMRIEDKKDVYPAEYFNGDWYFSESVVDTKEGSQTSIGWIAGGFDLNFQPATKIKFFRTAGNLKGYNIAVDEELSVEDTLELTPVISIPAEGKNYKVEETGLYAQMSEVQIDDIALESAPYMDVDFEKISTMRIRLEQILDPRAGFGNTAAGAIKQIKFSADSFSFTLEDTVTGQMWKYSFLRAEKDRGYTPRRNFKRDREKFGYFESNVPRIPRPHEDYREEDFERTKLLQRHNPKKDIVFYFSNLTPKDNAGKCRQLGDDSLGDVVGQDGEINFRELGRRSIKYWNDAFKVAGAPKGVILKEVDEEGNCFDAPLGDLEYNSINLIDSIQSSNLLGVGPSLVDAKTGEVINTTTNVHISPFRQIIASEIRTYIKSRLGVYTDNSNRLDKSIVEGSTILGEVSAASNPVEYFARLLPAPLKKFVASQYHFGAYLKDVDTYNLPRAATVNGFGPNDPVNLYDAGNFDARSPLYKKLQVVSDFILTNDPFARSERSVGIGEIKDYRDAVKRAQLVEKYRPEFFRRYFSSENSALATMNNLTEDIETQCTEVVEFVKNKKAAANGQVPQVTSAEENPVVKSCMVRLIPEKMLATIVHELGHNLGLRHNFYGSADKRNFFTKDEVKQIYNIDVVSDNALPQSSSVMDYVPSDKDRLSFPGHYDIAAIRYGYANAVELESNGSANTGKVEVLNEGVEDVNAGPEASVVGNAQTNGWTLRDFKYCTDEHASMDLDPMCQRHDYGTTPEESVSDIINQFYESLVVSGNRYDRVTANANSPFSRMAQVQRLRRFYDEWRFKLADYLGAGKEYLDKFNPKEYEQLLVKLESDPNFQGKEYLKVRRRILDFFKDIILLDNKYCVAFDPVLQQVRAVELEKIRKQVRHKHLDAIIPNCNDPKGIVKAHLQDMGLQYVGDIGFNLNNYKYMVDDREAVDEPIDVVGTFIDRVNAMSSVVSRSSGVPGFLQKMNPNMLDEPDFFLEFESVVLNRILNGVNIAPELQKLGVPIPENQPLFAQNYEIENPVLLSLWALLEQGARNPYVDSSSRTTRYGRFVQDGTPDLVNQVFQEGGQVLGLDSGKVLIIRKENTVSLLLVQKFYEIVNKINAGSMPVPTASDLKTKVLGVLTPLVIKLPMNEADMTAEEYIAFGDSIVSYAEAQNSDPYAANLSLQLVMPEVAGYLIAFKPITDQIKKGLAQNQDVTELQAQLNNILAEANKDFAGFLKGLEPALRQALNDPNFVVRVPSRSTTGKEVTQKIDALIQQTVEQATLAKADYEANRDEYMSQATMLRSVLVFDSGLSNYVGQIMELLVLNNSGDRAPGLEMVKARSPRTYVEYLSPAAYVDKILETDHITKLRLLSFDQAQSI